MFVKERGAIHNSIVKAPRTDKLQAHLSKWHFKALKHYKDLSNENPSTTPKELARMVVEKYRLVDQKHGPMKYSLPVSEAANRTVVRKNMHLLFFVVNENLPFTIFQSDSLSKYYEDVGIKDPPKRKEMTKFAITVSNTISKIVDQKLKSIPAFSITTNTHKNSQNQSFVSITYNAIDPETYSPISLTPDVFFSSLFQGLG